MPAMPAATLLQGEFSSHLMVVLGADVGFVNKQTNIQDLASARGLLGRTDQTHRANLS